MFGPDDAFLSVILKLLRRFPVYPMFGRGETRLQPAYVEDVAEAIGPFRDRTLQPARLGADVGLKTWIAPEGVRSVLIAADRGRPGAEAAGILAERLRQQQVKVQIEVPPAPHGDWNDWARAQTAGG
jgi:uncharacterized protein YbjT (DUF2867 family)